MAATLIPATEPIPGYRLIERIGRGGFGEVWKCEAPGGFYKAIKLVYGSLDDSGDEGKGAEQEKKALERIKQIRHPFLLSLERYDIIDGQLRIVMELADRSLWDRFRECRGQSLPGIPREELLRYLAEASEALDMMNVEYNLQHLDVKPQNLFLVRNHVKVADFGLVKLFEGSSASVTGGVTPVYAAPETFDGRATRFSDQYSLAIVYQELLVGVRPFNGTNTRQLVLQHLTHAPNLAPLPEGDRGPVGRALAKSELDRFPTCAAFIAALQVQTGEPAEQVSTPSPAARLTPPNGQNPSRARVPLPSQLISRPAAADPSMTQSLGPAMATMPRPADVSASGPLPSQVAGPPELTGPGALIPAVVIGVGAVGDRVIRYLRRAVGEQFGGPQATPHLRMLSVDTDAETATGSRDTILARLYRPSHYLAKSRDGGALDWLSPGLLYRLPRNPSTTGLRGLGRLAFWDHAKAIENRLKADLQAVLNPAALSDADCSTGLGVRTNRPRVYVVANLAGGTGGGMFVDIGYLARHVLRNLGYAQPDVVGILLLPPTDKNGPRPVALANIHAALVELAHFSRPDTTYEAKFGPRDPAVLDSHRPFGRCLCLPLPAGSDPAARRLAAGGAAGVVFRELLAPLGRAADMARPAPTANTFCHTVGTYRLSWPGRRLARRAGQHLAAHLLRQWIGKNLDAVRPAVTEWLDEQWESRQLAPEQLIERLTAAAEMAVGGPPDARFDALVDTVAAQPLGTVLDARSACLALNDIAELAGKPVYGGDEPPPGTLQKAIAAAAFALTAEYEQKLAELAVHFIELPRLRLAGAEEAIRQLTERLRRAVETYDALAQSLTKEATEQYARLFPLIGMLDTVSAGKRSALTAEVVALLRTYPKKRYQALLARQVLTTYRGMVSAAPEYLREVSFCRNRLNEAAAFLEQLQGDAGGASPFGPGRDLYSGGRRGLDEAAADMVARLSAEELADLDHRVQVQVRTQFRAVITYCLESTGSPAPLADLVREQAERYLAGRSIGDTGAAAVFSHFAADPQAAHRAAAEAYDEAEPTLVRKAGIDLDLLAAPAGPAGDDFRRIAGEAVSGVELLPADSPDEIVFYRERAGLALTDLPQFGSAAKAAYDTHRDGEHVAHARGDIAWKPPMGR